MNCSPFLQTFIPRLKYIIYVHYTGNSKDTVMSLVSDSVCKGYLNVNLAKWECGCADQ